MIWEGVEVSRRVSAETFFTQWVGVLGRAVKAGHDISEAQRRANLSVD